MNPHISRWNQFLCSLADELLKDNIKKIKFILKDYIPASVRETLDDGHTLLNELEKRNIISCNDLSKLGQILADIGRKDLLSKIKSYMEEKSKALTSVNEISQKSGSTFSSTFNSTFNSAQTSASVSASTSVLNLDSIKREYFVENTSIELGIYSMHNVPSGICIIFSNYFDKEVIITDENKKLEQRLGNGADESQLKETFTWLNFDVLVYKNKSSKDIVQLLYSNLKNSSIQDCFVCCILSHGYRNGIYGSDGSRLSFEELWTTVEDASSESLQGKPKLFFIQACQTEINVKEMSLSDIGIKVDFEDVLTSLATLPGKVAFRDVTRGSWYIQTLCETLKNRAYDSSLLDILTELNSNMASKVDYYKVCSEYKIATQMSSIQSCTLSKKLFFKPYDVTALSRLRIF
ncbi:caspase-8 [Hydra vulgaris]|uniref:DED caspase n=1 Tax=Hydra vulgaris TaxID=6087 RepID=D2KFF8_HYDVU|nr:caspase-8 [Hydra vulgaris]ACZ98165.1 DED caspase [Hydra vulgaris]